MLLLTQVPAYKQITNNFSNCISTSSEWLNAYAYDFDIGSSVCLLMHVAVKVYLWHDHLHIRHSIFKLQTDLDAIISNNWMHILIEYYSNYKRIIIVIDNISKCKICAHISILSNIHNVFVYDLTCHLFVFVNATIHKPLHSYVKHLRK